MRTFLRGFRRLTIILPYSGTRSRMREAEDSHRAMSGAMPDRCEALEFSRSGDTLIVRKLDRLARSMKQLIETIERQRDKGIGVSQPDQSPRHDDRARSAYLTKSSVSLQGDHITRHPR